MTHVRPLVRPFVRPLVRSGASGPYGGTVYQDGIHLNFASGNTTSGYYVKAVGAAPTVSPLTSLFTFTGGNQSMYMGPGGLLVASATNTPRIEYDANGNCLGLLMEAARTNLCLQSEVAGTTWVPTGATISTNFGTSPSGASTSDKIVEDGATSTHLNQQNITVSATTTYTFSCFLKAAGRQWAALIFDNGTANGLGAVFDLSGGTISRAVYAIGTGTATSAVISNAGNGWFRCSITGQIPTTTGRVIVSPSSVASPGTNYPNYAGDSSSGAEMWGAQLELGAFPSSYIPTTTASVARTADSCIRTLGSEFSATAGTVVVAGRASGGQEAAQQFVYEFGDGTGNESTRLQRQANTDLCRVNVADGGVGQSGGLTDFTFVNSTAFKHALAWSVNDLAASLNGAAVTTDAVATIPTTPSLALGLSTFGSPANGHILRFDYWPERRSNAFLQQTSA